MKTVAMVANYGTGNAMYRVLIRDNETAEERWVESLESWDDAGKFMWTEGNYGCDCNRHLFFDRAAGREPEADELICGETRYTAVCAELTDGTQIQLDGDV